MHNDKELDKIYKSAFDDAIDHMRRYEVQAVAATYMAIAMRLYKTHLDEDSYKDMIQTIIETEVEEYKHSKIH